jgi:hypothetical protein
MDQRRALLAAPAAILLQYIFRGMVRIQLAGKGNHRATEIFLMTDVDIIHHSSPFAE